MLISKSQSIHTGNFGFFHILTKSVSNDDDTISLTSNLFNRIIEIQVY